MALITCRECGAQVSSTAATCPGCGAGPKAFARAIRRVGCLKTCLYALLTLFAVSFVIAALTKKPEAPKTPADAAAEAAANLRVKAATFAGMSVRAALRDPGSLTFEYIGVSDRADAVCVDYRARNGLGGLNRERAVFVEEERANERSAWRRHCAGKRLHALTKVGDYLPPS